MRLINWVLIAITLWFGIVLGLELERAYAIIGDAPLREALLFGAGTVGFAIAIWRTSIADRTAKAQFVSSKAAEKSSDAALKQANELVLKNLVDRHANAVEQLAEDGTPVHKRVYAIVILNELCQTQPALRPSTLTVLLSFIRNELRVIPERVKEVLDVTLKDSIKNAPARREDLATALRVIKFFFKPPDDGTSIDLAMNNLYAADFQDGHLSDSSFSAQYLSGLISQTHLYSDRILPDPHREKRDLTGLI